MSNISTIINNSNNGSSSSSSSSSNNRLNEIVQSLPATTFGIISICTLLYIVCILILNIPIDTFTFCSALILYHGQIYRIISSVFFHANIVHLLMNMISTFTLGLVLEQQFGTIRLFYVILLSMFITSFLLLIASVLFSIVFQYHTLLYQHSIGFSGILFHLLVLECNFITSTSTSSRNLFGSIKIPSYLYPWVLLIVLQIMIPNLSFSGHLSGIIVGTMQIYGYLLCMIPTEQQFVQFENSYLHWCITSFPTFVPTTTSSMSITQYTTSSNSSCRYIQNIYEKAKEWLRFRSPFRQSNNNTTDDDDDWNGLPILTNDTSAKQQQEITSLLV